MRTFNTAEYANDGGASTVDVANPFGFRGANIDMRHASGASNRLVFEAGGGTITMKYMLPGGTDLHRDNAQRYNQLLDKWLRNEPIDFPFGKDAVKNPQETIDVQPAP